MPKRAQGNALDGGGQHPLPGRMYLIHVCVGGGGSDANVVRDPSKTNH